MAAPFLSFELPFDSRAKTLEGKRWTDRRTLRVEPYGAFGRILSETAGACLGVSSRRARTQCVNNLKQIALACHNYNATWNSLPPGQMVANLPNLWEVTGYEYYGATGTAPVPQPCVGLPWTTQLFSELEQLPTDEMMMAMGVFDFHGQNPNAGYPNNFNVPDNWEHIEDGGIGAFAPDGSPPATENGYTVTQQWTLPGIWTCPSAPLMTVGMGNCAACSPLFGKPGEGQLRGQFRFGHLCGNAGHGRALWRRHGILEQPGE